MKQTELFLYKLNKKEGEQQTMNLMLELIKLQILKRIQYIQECNPRDQIIVPRKQSPSAMRRLVMSLSRRDSKHHREKKEKAKVEMLKR